MAVSENGANGGSERSGSGSSNGEQQQKSGGSEGRTLGGRSASPAKRRAAEMESGSGGQQRSATESVNADSASMDVEMEGMTPAGTAGDTQDSTVSTAATSINDSALSLSSATSLTSDHPPDRPKENGATQTLTAYSTADIDNQVASVEKMRAKPIQEGDWGVCISKKWINRVLSRTTQGLASKDFPQEAREGPIGPLDNSDIVPDGAFDEPLLQDAYKKTFIPLKPGLEFDVDLVVVPHDAYSNIVVNYGNTLGQKHAIIRYAHNTADEDATGGNVIYELYPPIITVRKVPQAGNEVKHKSSLEALKARRPKASYGQISPDDALRLVSSKAEKFQDFLKRAKEAAAIPVTRKVKLFRLMDASSVAVDKPDHTMSGVLSPPASRDPSPSKIAVPSLIVSPELFKNMELGKDLEPLTESFQDQTYNSKYNGQSNMATAGFFQDKTVLLEEQIGGPAGGEFQSDSKKVLKANSLAGSKPASTTASGRTSPAPNVMTRGRRKDGRTRGVTGLSNLGNTCYMNSALQCIRSVEELAVYFLSKKYKAEINADNPLGYHGAMANAYAGVLKGIYESSTSSSFSPSEFKKTLGRYQPLFSGYGQQDSQEFLSFLVDALHEDLNRIIKKPYIENPDSDDDKVHDPAYIAQLGETYRNNHKQRNDSIAMDLFSGHYKNKMECPECKKVSVTFDPYSLVTVQLPMEITWQHPITYIPLRGKPVLHHVEIDKNVSIKGLKDVLAKKHPGADANRMWMIESYASKIFKVFDDNSAISESNIQPNDYIFVYELEQIPKNGAKREYGYNSVANDMPRDGMDADQAEVFTVPILSQSKKNLNSRSLSAFPLYITVTREEAKDYDIILKKVLIAVANTTSRPILEEFNDQVSLSHVEDAQAGKGPASSEDSAGVSDHSAQSEDGYVNVSIGEAPEDHTMSNGVKSMDRPPTDQTVVPANFMDPQYYLSEALRTHLFDMKYHETKHGMQFSMSMAELDERMTHDMFNRVKQPSRRSSVQSSGSEESSTSTGSGDLATADKDDSDAKGFDNAPDIVLGGEQPQFKDESSDDELTRANDNIMEPSEVFTASKPNKRKNHKNRRGKKGRGANQNGYATSSKRDKRAGQHRPQYSVKRAPGPSDSPYYIQLGEAIVLDWHPEAEDSLFGGDSTRDADDDMRGYRHCGNTGRDAPVFPDPEQDAKRSKREQRKKLGVSLDDCFDVTSQPEILSEDNAWYCNRCKELRRATKTLEIWTLPDILVVHLKRFGGTRSFRDKVDLKVDYPIEGLDMNDRVGVKEQGKDYIYDLFAVDNHYGGLGGGHYTAMAKNFNDGQWYNYNDSSTSSITNSDGVLSAAAYLLFYRRRSEQPLGPQALQDLVHEYRNPSAAEDADEDDSGEGRLDVVQSGLGSSSVLGGAGRGVMNSQKGLVGNGGAGVEQLATQKIRMISDDSPSRSGLSTFTQGASWNFDSLQENEGSDRLLHKVAQEEDSSSTAADVDRDSAFGDMEDDGPPSYDDVTSSPAPDFIHVENGSHVEDRTDDITLDDEDLYS